MAQDLLFRFLSDKRLRLLASLLLLAVLAQQLSLLVWHFYPAPGVGPTTQRDPIVHSQGVGQPATNFQQQAVAISQAFLFGQAEVAAAVVVEVEQAPETRLNYKLRGTYFSSDPRLSSAIVEVQPNKSKYYLLDDELAENITLAAIQADHILINRYGKIERLNLLKKGSRGAGAASGTRSGAISASGKQVALLRSYRKRYASNPMALATRFQAIPVARDGRNIGFKLKPLRGESLLKRLEFEANDIFTAVNGVGLNNPFEALDALKSLTTAKSISVTIIRNGSELTRDFKL